jgi:hypothetical protein
MPRRTWRKRRRGGVYTPEWLDFSPTDPGVTTLELFAFLGESLLYRWIRLGTASRRTWVRRRRSGVEPRHIHIVLSALVLLAATMLAWRCALRRPRRATVDKAEALETVGLRE